MKRAGLVAACGAAALAATTAAFATTAKVELLARDAAEAASRANVDSGDAALLLGGALAATDADSLPPPERQFIYVEAMLGFLAADASAVFKARYGDPPEAKPDWSSAVAPEFAGAAANLRDAYLDRWRNSAVDPTQRKRDWLAGASYFAHMTLRALEASPRRNQVAEIDALVNLGAIQHDMSGRDDSLTAAIAGFALRREQAKALADADAAFAATAIPAGRGEAPPSDDFAASAVEALAPVALAAVGAGTARQALAKKDAETARVALDTLAGAATEIENAESYLAASWPCSPGLVEGRLWRARQAALSAQYQELAGGGDVAKLQASADRDFKAALAISLHAGGGDDPDFQTARDSYLRFLREAGRDPSEAQSLLVKAAATPPGAATPAEWRDALVCQ